MKILSTDSQKIIDFLDTIKMSYKVKLDDNIRHIYKNIVLSFKKIEKKSNMTKIVCFQKELRKDCNLLSIVKNIYPQFQNYLHYSFKNDEKHNLNHFLNNLDTLTNSECEIWMNLYGAKLMTNFNMLISLNKIPKNMLDNDISGIYNRFCPLNVQREIETSHNIYCINNGNFEKYSTNLKIHSKSATNIKKIKTLHNYALLMFYLSNSNIRDVNLKLFLTSQKKYFPSEYKMLGPKEINTGSTLMGKYGNIKIWRKEELYKLILHEMIHYLHLDIKMNNKILPIYQTLYKIFNISDDQKILINESYTETWACIINAIIVSYKFGDKLNLFKKMIDYERLFSCFQIGKILRFFGYKNFDEFFNLSGKFNTEPKWKQTTNVFSYHIIKGAFLFSINRFIDFCVKNNKEHWMKFDNSNINIHSEFRKLIIVSCSNPDFKKCINMFMKKQNKTLFINKTLRMTALELV